VPSIDDQNGDAVEFGFAWPDSHSSKNLAATTWANVADIDVSLDRALEHVLVPWNKDKGVFVARELSRHWAFSRKIRTLPNAEKERADQWWTQL
jgi:hypothetical protein